MKSERAVTRHLNNEMEIILCTKPNQTGISFLLRIGWKAYLNYIKLSSLQRALLINLVVGFARSKHFYDILRMQSNSRPHSLIRGSNYCDFVRIFEENILHFSDKNVFELMLTKEELQILLKKSVDFVGVFLNLMIFNKIAKHVTYFMKSISLSDVQWNAWICCQSSIVHQILV